jgi:hypothetical protein
VEIAGAFSFRSQRGNLADAVRLVEKVVAVAQRLLCVLIDRNCDRLDVLEAMALTRGALA